MAFTNKQIISGDTMDTKDLTPENLKKLIDISNEYNIITQDYLTETIIQKDTPEKAFLTILWYANFQLYEINEFKRVALEFIYRKELSEMPRYINDCTIQ